MTDFSTEVPFLVMIPVKVYAETDDEAIEHVQQLISDRISIAHVIHGDMTAELLDESSSASRQHFIDTGRYLTVAEVLEMGEGS